MSRPTVDLDTCDREPIHFIGAVQPHGALIAIDASSQAVDYMSVNAPAFLRWEGPEILGQRISDVIGIDNAARIEEFAQKPSMPELLRPWFFVIRRPNGTDVQVECQAHRNDGHIILEFLRPEPVPAPVWEDEYLRRGFISELMKPGALGELADVSARIIRDVTGFDRVMIYRFAEDKHGEVIAESTVRPDSFLGLHYPASDIPDPARRHFLLNVMRSIPDVNGERVPIIGRSGAVADADSAQPLDLTFSKLRSVAPVHVEYLNNMGVGASLSISLITNNQLWGLVACHHYGQRLISSSRLRFAELLGGTTSALLQSIENTNQLKKSIEAEKRAFRIEQEARSGAALRTLIADQADDLMALIEAHGMVLSLGGETVVFGTVPDKLPDLAPLRDLLADGVATSSKLSDVTPMDEAQMQTAAGAALLDLSGDGQDCLVLLRSQFEHTIRWAGKPDKIETKSEDGVTRLSPRGSFALWREERLGQSKPFDARDREALRILRRALFALNSLERERAALLAQKAAEAEEARLRHALLDASRASSMGELASAIAHELNQPLSAITNFVSACRREFENAGVPVPQPASTLLDEALAETERAGDLIRRVRNFISAGDLNAELIDIRDAIRQGIDLALVSGELPGLTVTRRLDRFVPPVMADRVQIGQVVLNLVRNSLAAMENSEKRELTVEIETRDGAVEVTVTDTGPGIHPSQRRYLFEPFHQSTTKGMGIGLSLCRSIVEAHGGQIWAEPSNSGAVMVFRLPVHGSHNA